MAAALTLTGCGASSPTDSAGPRPLTVADPSNDEQQATTAQTTTSPPQEVLLPMPATATLRLTGDDGYTATAVFRHGPLRPAGSLQNGDDTLGSACTVDEQTDAVEPFQLEVTNTTAKFSATPGISFSTDVPPGQNPTVSAEIAYTDGPQCVTIGQDDGDGPATVALEPLDQLQPGQSITADGFLIVSDYYSPAYPDGNAALIRDVLLQFSTAGTGSFGIQSGTGLVPQTIEQQGEVVNDAAGYATPLEPGARSCIILGNCRPAYNVGNTP